MEERSDCASYTVEILASREKEFMRSFAWRKGMTSGPGKTEGNVRIIILVEEERTHEFESTFRRYYRNCFCKRDKIPARRLG
jgi:hypothetical protein